MIIFYCYSSPTYRGGSIPQNLDKSRLKKPGESQYFNDGCCVFPCAISGIEINHGSVLLVKWSIYVKGDNSLQIVRNLVTSPVKLEDYLKVTN